MTDSSKHLSNIELQFTKHGVAYQQLDYVKNQAGFHKIVALADARSAHTVLDIACGPGYLSFAFAETCASVVGIDITDAFLEHAREHARANGIENVEFSKGDVESLTFDDNFFDIAICRAAFHHFLNPLAVLGEMKRATKPGGKILVLDMVSSEDEEKAALQNKMEILCDPTHVHALSESEFNTLFDSLDLQVVSTKKSQTKYSLTQWINHGGPSPENEQQIRDILSASLDKDHLGLPVWEEKKRLHFGHNTSVFILTEP
jgi:ubiquinone/menaquinone biosynthesis C-methylase UbiE